MISNPVSAFYSITMNREINYEFLRGHNVMSLCSDKVASQDRKKKTRKM